MSEDRPPCHCSGCQSRPGGRSFPGLWAAGWHRKKGPLAVLERLAGTPLGTPGLDRHRWIDHPYRWRDNEHGGGWVYVAEPYGLDENAFDDFAVLRAVGFEVTVSASRARHYPGHTVAVEIRESTTSREAATTRRS